jgi:hypothetical protein
VRGQWELGNGMKMLENEKYWNNPCAYEYIILIVSCWILGEDGDRERGSKGA